ncbi:MAG: CheR family methyltransferase [Spirochaetales bacterium]
MYANSKTKPEETTLPDALFKQFTQLLQELSGITLKDYKKYLMEYRLQKLVGPDKPFSTYSELYKALLADRVGTLRTEYVNVLTTNYTYFFREEIHFQFLAYYLRTKAQTQSYLRFWSAACSSGEEAYSMAMVCAEESRHGIPKDLRILATDISYKMLAYSQQGIYPYHRIRGHVPDTYLKRYFAFNPEEKTFTVRPSLREFLQFRYLNLMEPYPFKRNFDIVFLRNVLIYFETKEKEYILQKIFQVTKPGGYLVLGLSESLVGVSHSFTPLKHSIYRKDVTTA